MPDVRLYGGEEGVMKPIRRAYPMAADPDIVLGTNGRVYVNAASIPLADRAGRRVVRCLELTPGEEVEVLRRVDDVAADLLVGLTTAKNGGSK
jgi:hypothetical protein